MITLSTVIFFLFLHWFGDFVLQTDEQAKGKSKSWTHLLDHTKTYSAVWLIPITLIWPYGWEVSQYVLASLSFVGITFLAHTITDYFTSRLNSRLWAEGKVHNFFVAVGFDQILHYIQLLLTYQFLFNNPL